MNLFSRLVSPWYPSAALGLEKGRASIVELSRGRGSVYTLRRAATIVLGDVIQPGFDHSNLSDPAGLANALRELTRSAGLLNQRRWSVTLPEATTRSMILTLETQLGSGELDEVLKWKLERGFGGPPEKLSISTIRLDPEGGKDRYLATAVRSTVLEEYERVFRSLGWRVGLVVPRHVGETQWLTRNGAHGDSLLISSYTEGFTAVIIRKTEPFILRTVSCASDELEDELYRLLLFYRDRRGGGGEDPSIGLQRLLVLGETISRGRVISLVNDTLGVDLGILEAEDLGLELPTRELTFDQIAAPAGLAMLSRE